MLGVFPMRFFDPFTYIAWKKRVSCCKSLIYIGVPKPYVNDSVTKLGLFVLKVMSCFWRVWHMRAHNEKPSVWVI